MFAVLPVAVFAVLFLVLLSGTRVMREAALLAFTAVTGVAVALVQVLSLFRTLTTPVIAICWAIALAIAVLGFRERIIGGARRLWAQRAVRLGQVDWAVVATLSVFGAGTLLAALRYPVVNFDSLTCHVARVFFWSQNRSIAAYPTAFGPQLFEGPLGAYLVLVTKQLALGTDRLANVVQWVSYAFAIVAVSAVAGRLGAQRRGQQVAAIVAAATPMAILQASTTQNDLNVAVWCLIAAYCVVSYVAPRPGQEFGAAWAAWTGLALGFALLTKPTAYMFCAPFFAWLAVAVVRRDGWRRAVVLASGVLVIALSINAHYYFQNARVLGGGDLIGVSAPGVDRAVSRGRDVRSLVTTALKNGSMELATPLRALNAPVESAVGLMVRAYGGQLEDPRTKEAPDQRYRLDERIANHDVASSPLPVLLLLAAAGVAFIVPGVSSQVKVYLACTAIGGLILASLISWNPYINRLLVGAVMLSAPVVGFAAGVLLDRSRQLGRPVLAVALAGLVGWGAIVLAFNTTNRLVPPRFAPFYVGSRDLGYWNTSYEDLQFRTLIPHLETPFKRIAAAIEREDARAVGLRIRTPQGWFPVYPLLTLLAEARVGYVGETLFPDRIVDPGFEPDVVVEVLPVDQYREQMADGAPRERLLIAPQHAGEHVLLLYRVPESGRFLGL